MGNLLRRISGMIVCLGFLTALTQCDEQDEPISGIDGKVRMEITDAPIDDENIESVFLTFQRIEINSENNGWKVLEVFDEPVTIDLLAYQNGETYFLTEEEMPSGNYSEIRLVLDMDQSSTYILYNDGTKQQLKVPSGSQSGYKIKGDFTIPPGGVVNLTLDWDLRKAIVEAGNSGQYILKPTVRLIVNEEASMIRGDITNNTEYGNLVVYTYEDDSFVESEFDINNELMFPNAISSASVENNQFTLAFLNVGIYDLYIVAYDAQGEFISIVKEVQDVSLNNGEIEQIEITIEE